MKLFKDKEESLNSAAVPSHIAIIMDGNGRWAKKRGLPRMAGHTEGVKTLKRIARYCGEIGVKYLTVYAFSTENWKRPKEEIDNLMKLLKLYIGDFKKDGNVDNICVKVIGDVSRFPDDVQKEIADVMEITKDGTSICLNIALNYGGRAELTYVMRKIAEKVKNGEITADMITEQMLSEEMYTAGMPDPDIIIRPSGEQRLSNFLLWQAAYTEFWYSDVLWPDFKPEDLDKAIADYNNRERRYGGI
ncbi:MAG: isoprenyl transferase [Ruminococcaceae bacterium]|nr:isoprenyl transferase [Oscillospiraceae bacterium]